MKKILVLTLVIIFGFCPVFAKDKVKVTNKGDGIYIFKVNTKKYGNKIKPYMPDTLTTTKRVYEENNFDFVVNAGFFDVKNGKTVSYVTIDNSLVGDVADHEELIKSLESQQRLDKVLSRGELRILEKDNKLKFDITSHNTPVEKGYTIKHALQAGPIIYPDMDLAAEGFVVYDENGAVKSQSVDILKRRERTAVGLKGKWLYIILFTKDYKVDAHELLDYTHTKLKLKKVLAFDGGLSTSLNYKDISIGSFGGIQRRVKSFLVIER